MRRSARSCVQATKRRFAQLLIYRCFLVLVLSLLAHAAFPQTPLPRIDSLEPNQANLGATVLVKVHGANFTPRIMLQIEGCSVQNPPLVTRELLQALVTVPPNTQPGYKQVVLWPYRVFGRFEIISPNQTERQVVPSGRSKGLPTPEPPEPPPPGRRPALVVSLEEAEPRNGHLLISALVKNNSNAPSHNAKLRAEADTLDKWSEVQDVPSIEARGSRTFYFKPSIPDNQYGKKTQLVLRVGASEVATDIFIPARPASLRWLYVVGGCAAIAALSLAVSRILKLKRRIKWQKDAKDNKPQLPCRECESYCRKQRVERKAKATLASYRVDGVLIIPRDPESESQGTRILLDEETVEHLNQAIAAHRIGEGSDEIRNRVARIAEAMLHAICEVVNAKTGTSDVETTARLKGSEIEFEFTLYRCKKKGAINTWEEEDSWKASIEDERDEPLATLRGLSTAEQGSSRSRASELAQKLMEFIALL